MIYCFFKQYGLGLGTFVQVEICILPVAWSTVWMLLVA